MRESTARGHILVVDDDDGVRRLFAEVLHHAGYATVQANSVASAARLLHYGDPQIICVLLDSRLPDGRGMDLLRSVRTDIGGETLPVIMITADDDPGAEVAGFEAGATDFLRKPVSPEALVARVSAHLRERAAWLAMLETASDRSTDTPLDPSGIAGIVGNRAFESVFQPIVDLRTGHRIGFEALTRFDDGASPGRRFAEASAQGFGSDLELATLVSAVDASGALPADAYVSLNVTPSLLQSRQRDLQEVLGAVSCPVVLEITEREAIDDYEAVRTSLSIIEPAVGLSIDDAGAGFASLRHVVMLQPDYVKLDRTWVSQIDDEPTKQAMVAGLVHFAGVSGCHLIAEGIETEDERTCLVELGVPSGQGFLLGRPERLS